MRFLGWIFPATVLLLTGCQKAPENVDDLYFPVGTFHRPDDGGKGEDSSNKKFSEDLRGMKEGRLTDYPDRTPVFRLFVSPSGEAIASSYLFRLDKRKSGHVLIFKASNAPVLVQGMTGPGDGRTGVADEIEQSLSDAEVQTLLDRYEDLDLCNQPVDRRIVQDGTNWVIEGFNGTNEYCVRHYTDDPAGKRFRAFHDTLFSMIPHKFRKYRWCCEF
ncbi:hypothetical protein [Roseovarius indicus]|uniref:Lipoprotein n=1 Tax=Roseovarius indicus TaxID=540747 RepID=A0A0T5P5B0_9RHOB|nr:hypothetical protein [Roseovarius indicus]KRS16293.1 hypothetical protein XM52_19745 [Roseovarius indicus]QEW27508.1 hypothetical protein RIdsm_03324 [Roseovarius indicus]SFD47069.1 hypothetical protein SAMN04488031_10121 [Roseovarius indicus]